MSFKEYQELTDTPMVRTMEKIYIEKELSKNRMGKIGTIGQVKIR